jgi:hypothetical protein
MMNIPFGRVPGMIVRPLREGVAYILNLTSQQLVVGVGLAGRILTLKRLSRWWIESHMVHALQLRRSNTTLYNLGVQCCSMVAARTQSDTEAGVAVAVLHVMTIAENPTKGEITPNWRSEGPRGRSGISTW